MDYNDLIEKQKVNMNNDWKKSNISNSQNELQKYLWDLSLNEWFKLINDDVKWKTVLSICAGTWQEAIIFIQNQLLLQQLIFQK